MADISYIKIIDGTTHRIRDSRIPDTTGSTTQFLRGDGTWATIAPSGIGAIAAPSSPSSGDFLVYNGTTWVAQSLSAWSGGSY